MNIWDQLIADDATEIDAEMLAAYAEGKLTDAQRAQLAEEISRSPRAIELLDGIRTDLAAANRESVPIDQDATAMPVGSHTPSRWRTAFSPLLAAAAVLFAVGVSLQSRFQRSADFADLQRDVQDLQAQLDSRTDELVRVELEHAYTLSSRSRPMLHAVHNRALVYMALADQTSRGAEDVSPELQDIRNTQIARLTSVAAARCGQDLTEDDPDALLDLAAVFLAANRLDGAQQFSDRARKVQGEETAELLNLEGAILFALAGEQTGEESEQLLAEAEGKFRRAVEIAPDFAPAWFNLAIQLEDREDLSAAAEVWKSYLAAEEDFELRDFVRNARGIDPNTAP